jgi:endonuclease YncB( thermonuclease family)
MPTLSAARYNRLKSALSALLEEARTHRSVDATLVGAYWSVGKHIVDTNVLEDAAYGDATLRRLSADLEVDVRTLQRSVAFSEAYQEAPAELTWSHYRLLLTLSDPKERAFYEELARGEGLNVRALGGAISSDVYTGKHKARRKVTLRRPKDPRYLFEAELIRVVDGDTLLVNIDLAFEVIKRQRIRLAAVNTFSATSEKGKLATEFVAERLTLADRILLCTQRADLHGRYLAHVFYSTKTLTFSQTFESGSYLNQELLDEKLAVVLR